MTAWLALYRLSNRRLAELGGMRAARLYSLGMAVSFGGLTLLSGADARSTRLFIDQALVSASWAVAGLSMFSATRDLEMRDRDDGIRTLADLRGHDAGARALMRSVSLAARIIVGVALPAISVVLLACAHNGIPWALRFSAFALLYASILGCTLALLSHVFARWAPQNARLAVLGCVLVPELLRASFFPDVLSLPAAFSWVLDQGERLGGALG